MASQRILLRTSQGLVIPGQTLGSFLAYFPPSTFPLQPSISWNQLAKDTGLELTRAELQAAVRSQFQFDPLIKWCLGMLQRLRRSPLDGDFYRMATARALADTFPAALEEAPRLLEILKARNVVPVAVSEEGLLSLLADALLAPWSGPGQMAAGEEAERRLCRFAMLAAELLDTAHRVDDDKSPYAAATILGVGRLRENDWVGAVLVRTLETYGEFLPRFFKGFEARFREIYGMAFGDWVRIAVTLVLVAERKDSPFVDTASLEGEAVPVRAVLQSLAATPSELGRAFEELREKGLSPAPMYVPFRSRPFVQLSTTLYGLVWSDFLLRAIEDRPYFGTLDALSGADKRRFQLAFGHAFEEYASRVLERCAKAAGGDFCRIPPEQETKRCDFALRFADDLVLVEAKRVGLRASFLMGEAGLGERLDEELGQACQQLLATADTVAADVARCVSAWAGWKPRRVFSWIVTHQPLFMWFSSCAALLKRAELEDAWAVRFSAHPYVFGLQELEHLEAALPTLSISEFLNAVALRRPATLLGFNNYLHQIGWHGPIASPYVESRKNEFLTDIRLTDVDPTKSV